jgi:hypothetical protein
MFWTVIIAAFFIGSGLYNIGDGLKEIGKNIYLDIRMKKGGISDKSIPS